MSDYARKVEQVRAMCAAGMPVAQQAARLGVTHAHVWKVHARLRKQGMIERLFPQHCTVPGCERAHQARGFCGSHYRKWRAMHSAKRRQEAHDGH